MGSGGMFRGRGPPLGDEYWYDYKSLRAVESEGEVSLEQLDAMDLWDGQRYQIQVSRVMCDLAEHGDKSNLSSNYTSTHFFI